MLFRDPKTAVKKTVNDGGRGDEKTPETANTKCFNVVIASAAVPLLRVLTCDPNKKKTKKKFRKKKNNIRLDVRRDIYRVILARDYARENRVILSRKLLRAPPGGNPSS